ncbi:MAG: non-canonical purine NTP pyrophosphatase, partial [Bacteroidota bacterium]
MRRLVLASRNEGKLREVRLFLADLPLEVVALDAYPDAPEVPEEGATFAANATAKALA